MTQQNVIDAWADMKSWVEGVLPGQATGSSIPNESADVGDIDTCNALNNPTGSQTGAIWGEDGDATIVLTSLTISTLSGVSIQAASFSDATTVNLPFSFSTLEVSGNYSYSQPCALYDMGKKSSQTTTSGKGSLSQKVTNNTLTYVASYDGSKLTLTSVTVGGTPSVNVTPDDGGMPSWLVAIANFFSTFNEQQVLQTSVENVFATADFSNTIISLLNKKVSGG
jgi:hypothetical protein